jgi:hypothetical protein
MEYEKIEKKYTFGGQKGKNKASEPENGTQAQQRQLK